MDYSVIQNQLLNIENHLQTIDKRLDILENNFSNTSESKNNSNIEDEIMPTALPPPHIDIPDNGLFRIGDLHIDPVTDGLAIHNAQFFIQVNGTNENESCKFNGPREYWFYFRHYSQDKWRTITIGSYNHPISIWDGENGENLIFCVENDGTVKYKKLEQLT